MHLQDKAAFGMLLQGVYDFYEKTLSASILDLWWQAMQSFELKVLSDTFSRHCMNPDNGQFLPKPADIVRLLHGSTKDSALIAWSKVEKAIRTVGIYDSVTFDDALIQQVLQDMGGWIGLGQKKEAEWPFVCNEFVNRYCGYRQRGALTTWPAVLVGMAQASNQCNGFHSLPPKLIGDQQAAQRVLADGACIDELAITQSSQQSFKPLSELPLPILKDDGDITAEQTV